MLIECRLQLIVLSHHLSHVQLQYLHCPFQCLVISASVLHLVLP